MNDDVANLTLRLLQDMRAEMATKADLNAFRAEFDTFRAETNKKFDLLAETCLNLAEGSRKLGGQLEILTMAFNRQGERLDRIEDRLGRVETKLGMDQTQH